MSFISAIDWKTKLSSRKLWAAVAAVVITILTALFHDDLDENSVNLIIGGVGAICAYIFGEGAIDVAKVIKGTNSTSTSDTTVSATADTTADTTKAE